MNNKSNTENITGMYLGSRDDSFKTLLVQVLKKGHLKTKYLNVLTSEESLVEYSSAFTSELVDQNNNYQVYEQIGDLAGNKFIVCYIYRRFPQLKCAKGVKVAARLRINYGSKQSFCKIAEGLGFWDFISATNELRNRKKKDLLEDVFEAFLGATESILDDEFGIGTGYKCVYKILEGIFDNIDISLKYEDLYDGKTRLKELFDIYGEQLGPLVYEDRRDDDGAHSTCYRYDGASYATRPDGSVNTKKIIGTYQKVKIGEGSAELKADAQQEAAKSAIRNLAQQGYKKHAPRIYAYFSGDREEEKTTEESVISMIENKKNIDEQYQTRGKSKYQCKYTSTVLAKYCRERDYDGIKICLKCGADPNVKDSEGMTSTDLLLIGKTDEVFVKKVLKRFLKVEDRLEINKHIFKVYYSLYKDGFFSKVEGKLKKTE